ncbi:MAG: phospholipase D family protein [Deltaproteobacteria bacterium]|nr:phospholipase D family protein [Deltaproteobacteria bacterium]
MFLHIVISCALICAFCLPAYTEQFKATGTVDVFFSPRGGATDAIVSEIASARSEILVQAYSFTSVPVAKALLDARKRGTRIEVVLDKSQRRERYSSADFLVHGGIPTYIDARHAIAHNKIMIIDRNTLITGSFNFTKAAEEKNAENLMVIRKNKPLVDRYLRNLEDHRDHSERYFAK